MARAPRGCRRRQGLQALTLGLLGGSSAPPTLYPISGLEHHLRRRLGDPQVLYRALRRAASRSGTSGSTPQTLDDSHCPRPARSSLLWTVPEQSGAEPDSMNVLLVTMDQFRGDCLSAAGHQVVRTPSLDRLAAEGLRLPRHYAQAAPCSPARASLYTGTYQMNNRVVGNGTPLDDRFDNVARVARRAGYVPTVFGYADQSTDPRLTTGPDDRRLWTYQGFPPGFEVGLDVSEDQDAWRAHLVDLGYREIASGEEALATEPERPAEHGHSAYLTDRVDRVVGATGRFVVRARQLLPASPPLRCRRSLVDRLPSGRHARSRAATAAEGAFLREPCRLRPAQRRG